MEPVAVNDLPERETATDANLGHTVRRLIALGLVRRYRQRAHLDRYHLTLAAVPASALHPPGRRGCERAQMETLPSAA